MGPIGTGVLAVRPDRFAALVPRLASWQSHVDPLGFLGGQPGRLTYDRALRHDPSMFEGGGRNLAGHAGLAVSLGLLLDVGVEAIAAHGQAWHDRLEPELLARGFRSLRADTPSRRSGILSVEPPPGRDAATIARGLAERGVSVATPDGLVRFSPGLPTALDEVDVVVGALDEVLR
jgi:selenocysteine lyase/cysteine desulfurase